MISRGFKKKSNKSPPNKKDAHKTTKKNLNKSKPKNKINPTQYLQALIDLQNTNCSTNRKKKTTKRDISSALTVATPALQKTISSSKIRSKSSFSHYRKKNSSQQQPQIINLNINAAITQQSNVQYTQKTARSFGAEHQQVDNIRDQYQQLRKKINYNICATKIQRAWRNYQTYKMVSQHFQIQKQLESDNKNFKSRKLQINSKRSECQKTLRIRKQDKGKKKIRQQQQFNQTNKIIMQRYKYQQSEYISEQYSPSPIKTFIEEVNNSNTHEICSNSHLQQLKSKQLQRLTQTIDLIQANSQNVSKQMLLNQLMKKIQENKKILQQDFRHKLETIQKQYNSINQPSNSDINKSILNSCQQQISSKSREQMNHQFDKIDIKSFISSQSNYGVDIGNNQDVAEIKLFDYRLQQIKTKRNQSLMTLDQIVETGGLSFYQATQRKQKIQVQYETQRKQIQKNRKQYIFSLTKLKKNALKCHGWILKQSSSLKKLRKSFSAGNTVIKNVLQEIRIDELAEFQFGDEFIDSLFNPFQSAQQNALLNTPIRSQYSQNMKQSELSQGMQLLESSTQIMKKHSQQIQQSLQKYLIDQIVYQIYKTQGLLQLFKPYIGQTFEFKKISDTDIIDYLSYLKPYMPHQSKILKRVNQKINPTTLQILRIIRDYDFQIQEYELVIPQEVFKQYRSALENQYKKIQQQSILTAQQIRKVISDEQIAVIIIQKQQQRIQKIKKYRNFQRDLKIMYMKSVFNCLNQFFIQIKSLNSFMNSRSSIGPGELKFALKQFNQDYDTQKLKKLEDQVLQKLKGTLQLKCSIPSFKSYVDLQKYQRQVMDQIKVESNQNQYKWVNYMDEILEIWQDLSMKITNELIIEASKDFLSFF